MLKENKFYLITSLYLFISLNVFANTTGNHQYHFSKLALEKLKICQEKMTKIQGRQDSPLKTDEIPWIADEYADLAVAKIEKDGSARPKYRTYKEDQSILANKTSTPLEEVPQFIKDLFPEGMYAIDHTLIDGAKAAVKSRTMGEYILFDLVIESKGEKFSVVVGSMLSSIMDNDGLKNTFIKKGINAFSFYWSGAGTVSTGPHVGYNTSMQFEKDGIQFAGMTSNAHSETFFKKHPGAAMLFVDLFLEKYIDPAIDRINKDRLNANPAAKPVLRGSTGHSYGAWWSLMLMRYQNSPQFKSRLDFIISLSPPAELNQNASPVEKVKEYISIWANDEETLKALTPEKLRVQKMNKQLTEYETLFGAMTLNNKTTYLQAIQILTDMVLMNGAIPDHKGREYPPAMLVMGAKDFLIQGEGKREDYIKNTYSLENLDVIEYKGLRETLDSSSMFKFEERQLPPEIQVIIEQVQLDEISRKSKLARSGLSENDLRPFLNFGTHEKARLKRITDAGLTPEDLNHTRTILVDFKNSDRKYFVNFYKGKVSYVGIKSEIGHMVLDHKSKIGITYEQIASKIERQLQTYEKMYDGALKFIESQKETYRNEKRVNVDQKSIIKRFFSGLTLLDAKMLNETKKLISEAKNNGIRLDHPAREKEEFKEKFAQQDILYETWYNSIHPNRIEESIKTFILSNLEKNEDGLPLINGSPETDPDIISAYVQNKYEENEYNIQFVRDYNRQKLIDFAQNETGSINVPDEKLLSRANLHFDENLFLTWYKSKHATVDQHENIIKSFITKNLLGQEIKARKEKGEIVDNKNKQLINEIVDHIYERDQLSIAYVIEQNQDILIADAAKRMRIKIFKSAPVETFMQMTKFFEKRLGINLHETNVAENQKGALDKVVALWMMDHSFREFVKRYKLTVRGPVYPSGSNDINDTLLEKVKKQIEKDKHAQEIIDKKIKEINATLPNKRSIETKINDILKKFGIDSLSEMANISGHSIKEHLFTLEMEIISKLESLLKKISTKMEKKKEGLSQTLSEHIGFDANNILIDTFIKWDPQAETFVKFDTAKIKEKQIMPFLDKDERSLLKHFVIEIQNIRVDLHSSNENLQKKYFHEVELLSQKYQELVTKEKQILELKERKQDIQKEIDISRLKVNRVWIPEGPEGDEAREWLALLKKAKNEKDSNELTKEESGNSAEEQYAIIQETLETTEKELKSVTARINAEKEKLLQQNPDVFIEQELKVNAAEIEVKIRKNDQLLAAFNDILKNFERAEKEGREIEIKDLEPSAEIDESNLTFNNIHYQNYLTAKQEASEEIDELSKKLSPVLADLFVEQEKLKQVHDALVKEKNEIMKIRLLKEKEIEYYERKIAEKHLGDMWSYKEYSFYDILNLPKEEREKVNLKGLSGDFLSAWNKLAETQEAAESVDHY
ncbi:MAG: hypothetical protein H6622_05500 [Halobacteriovoraceae bacterium]|nr:hypothetical protein [Halobacteriovoraceae bacterium]